MPINDQSFFLTRNRLHAMVEYSSTEQRFSLQEVAAHCGLAPYIIRYWELHFPQLSGPNGAKDRFSQSDIALLWRIKKYLYVDHMTIDQAKAQLLAEQAFPISEVKPRSPWQTDRQTQAPAPAAPQSAPAPQTAPVEQTDSPLEQACAAREQPTQQVAVRQDSAVTQPTHGDAPNAQSAPDHDEVMETVLALNEAQKRAAEHTQRIAELERRVQELEAQLAGARQQAEEAREQTRVLQSQKDEESRQKAELDAQLRAMQASTTDAGHRTAALEQQNAALNGKLARVLQELREIAGTLQSVPN